MKTRIPSPTKRASRSADFQSAVSQADCKSAIQQIANLRYASRLIAALVAVSACSVVFGQSTEVCTNRVQGTLTFNNANPAVLDLLEAPGNEGMSNVFVYAYSVPPGRYSSSAGTPTATRTSGDYAVTVSVECNDSNGIPYQITPVALLNKGQQYYYADSKTSAPIVAAISGPVIDFEECLGVVQFNFVDDDLNPVAVNNGTGYAIRTSDGAPKSILYGTPSNSTQQRFYVEGGREHRLDMYFYVGSDPYTDRQVHYVSTNVTIACDEILDVNIVIPSPENLAEIIGTVDMLGEFEWSALYYQPFLYPGYTAVVAQYGPFQNNRWDLLPGDNMTFPSSGAFNLVNVVPSTLDPQSAGYYVNAQMLFRTNRAAQYFRTPGLGWGSNARVVVEPGQTVNLSNIFEINPGYLRGKILLQGPPEISGHPSLLRGVSHAGDNDLDGDGIPDAAGTYGIYGTTVGYEGVNRRATGATYTAANGYAYGDFVDDFDEANNRLNGRYELAVGGLQGESSIWRPFFVNLVFSSGVVTNEDDYFYNVYTLYNRRTADVEVPTAQPVTNDLALCFSEVRVSFSSPDTTFYSPLITIYSGGFTGIDFQGQLADYFVNYVVAYGTPSYVQEATNRGQVTLYLPQGTYTLLPSVTPGDGSGGSVGLEPIAITIGCAERLELEPCLQMNLAIPACYRSNALALAGSVLTRCSNNVTQITYELNGSPPQTVCNDCGANPNFNFTLALAEGDNTLIVTAYDDNGRVTSVSGTLRPDSVPPTIQCPVDSIAKDATRPCGATVVFTVPASDNCDPSPFVVCSPPSGSFFPRGTTAVNCTAIDVAGNSANCSFPVFVGGGPDFPTPTITSVSPQTVGVLGGAQMVIRGTDFTMDDEVLLDGVPLNYRVLVSTNEIQGQAPALPDGSHHVQIRRCGEIVVMLSNAVVSGTLPRVFACDPPQSFARGSNYVTIRGSNFIATTQVRIGFAATGAENLLINAVVSADGSTIVGFVPPLPAGELLGPRDVIVEDARGRDVLPAGMTYLPNPFETDPQVISLRALQAASTQPLELEWRRGFPGAVLARVRMTGASPEESARAFLRSYATMFRLQNPDTELAVRRVTREILDDVRLVQNYRGVPVFGAEVVVSLLSNEVKAVTGNLLPLARLEQDQFSITPQVTPEQAIDITRADENLQRPLNELMPVTELMIFDQGLFSDAPLDARLVWRVRMNFAEHELMVDAQTGAVVARLPLLRNHNFDLEINDAENEANAQSHNCFHFSDDTVVADEDDFNSDYNNDLDAVLANRFSRACWSYFHDVFGWHSFDGDGSVMEVFIHTTMNPANVAQWARACDLMQFANGAVDYEILVHEFTHGVVNKTSGLQYQFQSGALDESYADVMAVIADRERGEVESGAPINWTFGEDLRMAPTVIAPLREFTNPAQAPYNDASHVTNLCCANVTTPNQANDFAGVHLNSGLPNKGAHLMVEGGSWGSATVTAMGVNKTRQVKFSALRGLANNANFVAARTREIAVAEAFVAAKQHGFTDADVCTVRNAWAAVGIGQGDGNCDGVGDNLGDTDGDFFPNKIDNCPFVANPTQADSDKPVKDGVGDACDNCVNAFNPDQADMDTDGQGDECDSDIDGDGCLNNVDQDPRNNQQVIGRYSGPTCEPPQNGFIYGFAGVDSPLDADTTLNCEDTDDDGDGIPDYGFDGIPGTSDDDECPVGPLNNSVSGSCTTLKDCPLAPDAPSVFQTCLFGGCIEYFARFTYAINPDPTYNLNIDRFTIVNQTVYLQPNIGSSVGSLSQAIQSFSQRLADRRAKGMAPDLVRLELWARGTETNPPRLVAVVGEFDPQALVLQQLESGNMLALSFETNGAPPSLGATWHVGADPSTAMEDSDADGIVDGWEILHGLNPRDPDDALLDSDGDGVSNTGEYLAGTDPRNALSLFRIVRLERGVDGVRLEFQGAVGRRFQVERTLDVSGGWQAVGAIVEARGGVEVILDVSAAGETQAFYRVRLIEQ